jgi:hypothetical protein
MSSTSKKMKSTQNEIIELDKQIINAQILKTGKYEKNGALVRKWEGETDSDSYIAQITKSNMSFIGILNGKFEREGYGLNNFSNGDQYFGYFEHDLRSKHGIYFWADEKKGNYIHNEVYYGFWKDNKKDNHGLYLWMDEPENNKEFDNANFDAFVGEIEEDKYKKGTYLSKKIDDYYLYHGNFDENGRKTDDNAFFYSSKFDRLLKGKIVNDNFENGYVAFFDSETGLINDLVYCTFGGDGDVTSIKRKDEIDEKEKETVEKEINDFRNVILEVDYFGNIYEKYKEIKEFIKEHMISLDVLDDKEKFPEIIKLCISYNYNNIYNDIEKKVFGRKL